MNPHMQCTLTWFRSRQVSLTGTIFPALHRPTSSALFFPRTTVKQLRNLFGTTNRLLELHNAIQWLWRYYLLMMAPSKVSKKGRPSRPSRPSRPPKKPKEMNETKPTPPVSFDPVKGPSDWASPAEFNQYAAEEQQRMIWDEYGGPVDDYRITDNDQPIPRETTRMLNHAYMQPRAPKAIMRPMRLLHDFSLQEKLNTCEDASCRGDLTGIHKAGCKQSVHTDADDGLLTLAEMYDELTEESVK